MCVRVAKCHVKARMSSSVAIDLEYIERIINPQITGVPHPVSKALKNSNIIAFL